MTTLPDRIARLTPERRLLLELMKERSVRPQMTLSDEMVKTEPFSLISQEDRRKLPDEVEDAYPLSRIQLGMLAHMEIRPDSPTPPAYHNVNSFRIRAPFDLDAMQKAVDRTVARHPVLRTSFNLTSYSEPLQLVHRSAHLPVQSSDLRHLSAIEQEEALRVFIEEENYRLFDLTCAPLLRYFVHRLEGEVFQFTLTEPHAISDGWSTNLTLAEVCTYYRQILDGQPLVDEPMPEVMFRDFIFLERKALESSECKRFWEEKLLDSPLTRLPRWPASFHASPTIEAHKLEFSIAPELTDRLHRVARMAAVPLKSVLFAAHLKVISLVTCARETLTGLVFNGRPEALDGDRVRGLFLNTLPVRFGMKDASWIDLARAALQAEVEILPYRRYPLSALQREHGSQPLFEVAFSYLHFHSLKAILGKVEELGFGGSDLSVTNFPLMVTFHQGILSRSTLTLVLEFDVTQFCAEQMRMLYSYYNQVLTAMADDPHARHDGASHLPRREQNQIFAGWAHGPKDDLPAIPMHRLFEAQVERSAEAIAVESADESLSYGELNKRANRLGRHLRQMGVGPEVPVGIFMGRSTEMLVGLLGVLKAGGAYMPLDPSHPKERLAFMLEDSKAPLVLCQRKLVDLLPKTDSRIVCLDSDWETIAEYGGDNYDSGVSDSNLAYIIYTSGSTGKPKGVMIPHRGLVNYLKFCLKAYGVEQGSGAPVHSSISFDLTITGLFSPLLAGRRVLILPEERAVEALVELLESSNDFSLVKITPAHLKLLSQELTAESSGFTRALVIGGEALTSDAISAWQQHAPQTRLINEYGPTETVVGCLVYEVPPDARISGPVPIGKPISNTHIYLVGHDLHPVPIGTTGEIYIGGDGLGRGYLNDPHRTALCFIPDPFSSHPGARLYKSGDLARYLPDGNIEYQGRADHQVKIRGYRIELGEIEAALCSHNRVRQAAVVARGEATQKQLVAYVVTGGEPGLSLQGLREHLSGRLPEYMLPARFVIVEQMPLTANGKVDRSRLPQEGLAATGEAGSYQGPRNEVEEIIAGIWENVLRVERVSVKDNFFELGGHSLAGFQVVSQIREAFGVEVRLRSLFEEATLEGLSRAVKQEMRRGRGEQIRRRRAGEVIPMSYAQQGIWIKEQMGDVGGAYNIPIVMSVEGELSVEGLSRALERLVRRHEILRTGFVLEEGEAVQVVKQDVEIELEVEELCQEGERAEEEVSRRIRQEVRRGFDLSRGGLMRVKVMRRGQREAMLVITTHHIVSDGLSARVMVRELGRLYEGEMRAEEVELEEMKIQYGDYAIWERGQGRAEEMEEGIRYWKEQLRGVEAVGIEGDKRGSEGERGYEGAEHSKDVEAEVEEGMRRVGRQEGATMFMVMMGCWAVVMREETGREEVVVGTNVANREREETQGLIGMMVNQVVLRMRVREEESMRGIVREAKRVAKEGYANQEVPYEVVVEEVKKEREGGGGGRLYEVKMDYIRWEEEEEVEVGGVKLRGRGVEMGVRHNELGIYIRDSGRGVRVIMQYNRGRYSERRIEEVMRKYERVMRETGADAEVKVKEVIERVREAEREDALNRNRMTKEMNSRETAKVKRKAILYPQASKGN